MARKPADIVERLASRRRIWFQIEDGELQWLPVSEAAFLLWVLAGLVLLWLVAALVLVVL